MTKEMKQKTHAYGVYRYRRFQALDDALQLFLHMQTFRHWLSTTDIVDFMEWDVSIERTNDAARKRARRLGDALVRVGAAESKTGHGDSRHDERFWRILV